MTLAPGSAISWIHVVAQCLGDLRHDVVFLGGATLGLFITDPAAAAPRPTKDVDVILELGSWAAYVQLQRQLRDRGFQEDSTPGAPLCRWVVQGIKVDVMPTREDILGFTNRWYSSAMRAATEVDLDDGITIRLVTAPHFVATKLEAFRGRGGDDYQLSHDLEDAAAIVDGRAALVEEISGAEEELREYLAATIGELLCKDAFIEALPGFLPGDTASQARLPLLVERLRRISALAEG